MRSGVLYDGMLCAAFWVALWRFDGPTESAARFVAGLALGALLARGGGLLWVPAGLFLVAPLSAPARASFLAAALSTLPLAFAVAKLGCVAAGCCAAAPLEALGFAAVGAALERGPPTRAAARALLGIALVRMVALPLRPDARGSAALAVLWLAAGALRCRPSHGDEACRRPGSATSSRTPRSSRPGCAASSVARATSR